MDRHHLLVALLGLLPISAGCSSTLGGMRVFSWSAAKPAQEEIAHKPATFVSFGNFRVASATAKETSPEQRQQYLEDARRAYQKALEVDEKYVPAYEAMARLLLILNDDAAAMRALKKGLELEPENAKLWNELAMCQCRAKQFDEGIASLRKALEASPGNRTYTMALGLALARAGKLDESLAALTKVNGEAKAHYDLARMLRHLKQPERAREHAQLALECDVTLAGPRELLAILDGKAPAGVQQTGHVEAGETSQEAPEATGSRPAAPSQTSGKPAASPGGARPAMPTIINSPAPVPAVPVTTEEVPGDEGIPDQRPAPSTAAPAAMPTIISTPAPKPPVPVTTEEVPEQVGSAVPGGGAPRLPSLPASPIRKRTSR